MILVELPEYCPKCGAEMEHGTLRAYSGGVGSTAVDWGPPNWGFSILSIRGERIRSGLTKVDFVAFQCPKCKIVIFNYGEEEEEPTEVSL